MTYLSLYTAAALFHAVTVVGQSSNTVNLAGIISEAAGIASVFGTPAASSATPSATLSHTSSAPTSSSATLSSTSAPSSTAASSTATSASTSASNLPTSAGGLTPQARTIIIAVSVVGGLVILGILIGLALCCCIRRRRKHRKLANAETREVGRNDWIHGRDIGGDDWNHGDNSHHGYISSHSDIDREPRIPEVAQHDSAPLMSEHIEEPAAVSTVHPAYRTHSWDGKNVNERNPFTPNPPITRKPVPHGIDNRKSHPFMAAGAGASLGAAAMHHHDNKKQDERDSGNSQSTSSAYTSRSGPLLDETDHESNFRDPNRPPTPFGLNAFGASPRRTSRSGAIEPSVVAHRPENSNGHIIDHPTDAQRRSLSERDMAPTSPSVPVPARSPNRTSFGSRGHAINPDDTPRATAYYDPHHNQTSNGNETDTSNESWQSAEATQPHSNSHSVAPPPPEQQTPSHPYWDDGNPYYAEPRHSGDHAFTNVPLMAPNATWSGHRNSGDDSSWRRSYEPFRRYGADGSPRRSVGADGKPRRLRFSDLSPEEYHYNYEPTHNVGQAL